MLTQMDRILFGDNQFFGVNHMSEEKARTQSMRFQDIGAIIEVLDDAYAEGIRTFMCTTHERISEVCDHFRKHAGKYPGFKFFPCLPYAHKYANAAAELGVLGAVRSFLPQENALGALLKGGMSLARKDVEGLAGLLIDAEMKMFADLDTQDADLIVAGAFGHSRVFEALFGGVTLELLRQPSLPLLLSH